MSLVQLHVYDITAAHSTAIRNFNTFGREVGVGGIFHGGIEINQQEWSYGYAPTGSGVYFCKPKQNPMYNFRETVTLGITPLGTREVQNLIAQLRKDWLGSNYELLTNNCLHFCDELAEALHVPKLPAWLNRMAYSADAVVTFANQAYEQVRLFTSSTQAWWSSYMNAPAPASKVEHKPDSVQASPHSSASHMFHVPPQLEALPSRHSSQPQR